jgi:hypothetical protein
VDSYFETKNERYSRPKTSECYNVFESFEHMQIFLKSERCPVAQQGVHHVFGDVEPSVNNKHGVSANSDCGLLVYPRQLHDVLVDSYHGQRRGEMLWEEVSDDLNVREEVLELDSLITAEVLRASLWNSCPQSSRGEQRWFRLDVVARAIVSPAQLMQVLRDKGPLKRRRSKLMACHGGTAQLPDVVTCV